MLVALNVSAEASWPAWRGPNGTGAAPDANPPIAWSESENIKWKVPLTGVGQSTPVVWGDQIFILVAAPADEAQHPVRRPDAKEQPRGLGRRMTLEKPDFEFNFKVVCLDLATGATRWERIAATAKPHEGHHQAGSYSAYSAVTDGALVWASFGSRGLHCFDVAGNPKWSQALDPMTIKSNFGEGSSPALADNAIVVVQDHEGTSKIRAFNKTTGDPLWTRERDEATSWSTPVAVEVDGAWQVITSAGNRIRAYDVKSGEVEWECGGMTQNVIPSPVLGLGNVYCASGFFGFAMKAIALGNQGDLTGSNAVVWSLDAGTPYVPSPLLYGERLYFIEDIKPFLTCVDARSGNVIYQRERLSGLRQIYASPVGAGGRVYITDRNGKTVVFAHNDTFELLAENALDDGFDASPIIVGDALLLKGNTYLYCIAAP